MNTSQKPYSNFQSIEKDGTLSDYDTYLIASIVKAINVPVIAASGVDKWEHLVEGIKTGADAVAAGNIFHYTEHSTKHAKKFLAQSGIDVR